MPELYARVEAALLQPDPAAKCRLAARLFKDWRSGKLSRQRNHRILPIDDPGQPTRPELVDPRDLERRSPSTANGRILLLHAIAHIEFNAINIALDATYRYRQMPDRFIDDWLLVAQDEARHFSLLSDELVRRGSFYGACTAHRGLWEMVCRTRGDALHRMALVPRVMEARGLDVTPGMIEKFNQAGDLAAAEILQIIYRDEIEHVRIGDRWFRQLCARRGLETTATFVELIEVYLGGSLRGPFNWPARIAAGFDADELAGLELKF